ncbi:MAG: phosphate ABC transporter permease PstA [Calditrichia bacterium]
MASKTGQLKKTGDSYILLTGVGLVLTLGMVFFIITVILVKGLGFFWPPDLLEVKLKDGHTYLGEAWERETVVLTDESHGREQREEIQLKIGNREIYGRDFIWINLDEVSGQAHPPSATTIERMEYGNFYGYIQSVQIGDQYFTAEDPRLFQKVLAGHTTALKLKNQLREYENQLNKLISPLTEHQRELSLARISEGADQPEGRRFIENLEQKILTEQKQIEPLYNQLLSQLNAIKAELNEMYLMMQTAEGKAEKINLGEVVRLFQPNRMNGFQKAFIYLEKIWEFVSARPRESNTEGGVFPAIFGTVMMVLLMSILVVPFGVLAAIYLNEYARQGKVVRLIRLSVNNLAGVPSIVYGIFGLGFFIYMIGGTLDQLFFSSKLPEPTFGTGGILWASLTLALLTLPVVVVATEEGILAVPRANKEGALALGATRWQMIRKIVLPNAMPGILTGLILAISRGAGEVAPLMITGVVKLAPAMPLDSTFPFLHLDRKFMHLGFHIYDVGFQSPNVEAAKPMVYTTALLLIFIVILLNLLAIFIRNRLRKKYKTAAF